MAVVTAGIFDNKVLGVLNKGTIFAIAPSLREIKKETQIGIERLKYAMRARDLGKKFKLPSHHINEVTKHLDNTDLKVITAGTTGTEKLIKEFRQIMGAEVMKLNHTSIMKILTKTGRLAIKDLKK